MTTDKNYLITGGHDGVVYISKLKRFDEGLMRREEPLDS